MRRQISVSYEDTDIAIALASIIDHKNKEEFVKLLTPIIAESHKGTNYFFKLLIGKKLPEIIPTGTLCKLPVHALGYSAKKDNILKSDLIDDFGNIIVTIDGFRSYDAYQNYHVKYTDVLDNGTKEIAYCYVEGDYLEVIEEI